MLAEVWRHKATVALGDSFQLVFADLKAISIKYREILRP